MPACDDCGLPGPTERDGSGGTVRSVCPHCVALAEGEPSIRISPLGRDDLELVMAWRSNPDVYRHFRQQDGPLDWEEHVEWFRNRDPDRYDFVVHLDDRRVGVVSISSDDEIGIFLGDPSARGGGVATAVLKWLCKRFERRHPLFAEVHEENHRSRDLFLRCGFQPTTSDDEWTTYVYRG